MLLKLATSSSELKAIVDLRKRVFVDELKIQDKNYQDVFNDYFCKNLMVIEKHQLVGAMRVAFDRHTQRFYASYFVTASFKRNRTTGVLLVGGMLRIMEENGIQTLYADSRPEILKEYLNFGCQIIGEPYRKYGFSCEWIPIRYRLSECTPAGNWMQERARQFLSSQQCQWKFPVKLILCSTIFEYETVLESLIATRKIFSTFPLLTTDELPSSLNDLALTGLDSIETQSAQTWLTSQSDPINYDGKSSFDQFNAHISRRRVLAVKCNSPLLVMAKCYAILTGKHLQVVDDFSELRIDEQTESLWVWMMSTDFSVDEWDTIALQTQKVANGLQISKTAQECSINLLQNYLDFIQPQTQPVVFSQGNLPVVGGGEYRHFATFGNSHLILKKGETSIGSQEQSFCQGLLENGFSFGDAVKRLNLEFSSSISSQPFLLIGDPASHIMGKQSFGKVPISTGIS